MKRKLGIIGGMGPLATADLFKKIITMTEAKSDQEHIHILIDNNTNIPDRTDYILNGKNNPLHELIMSAQRLQALNVDCIVMPCNTAHYFYDSMVKEIKTPILNMIEETALYISKEHKNSKIALLSTEGTSQSGIYDRVFSKHSIRLIKPDDIDQMIISSAIYDLKKGNTDIDLMGVEKIVNNMKKANVEFFILGCTELPIIFSMHQYQCKTIDPTTVLATAAINYLGEKIKQL